MRGLLWLIGLFAAAVGLVLAAHYNNGYVLLVLPPWRVDLSLNLAILIAAVAVVFAYLVMRATMISIAMPGRVRSYLKRRNENRARAAFNEALVNFRRPLRQGREGGQRRSRRVSRRPFPPFGGARRARTARLRPARRVSRQGRRARAGRCRMRVIARPNCCWTNAATTTRSMC
jgi:HemY protein